MIPILIVFAIFLSSMMSANLPADCPLPSQQIIRQFEGHQQGETKRVNFLGAVLSVSHVKLFIDNVWNPEYLLPHVITEFQSDGH